MDFLNSSPNVSFFPHCTILGFSGSNGVGSVPMPRQKTSQITEPSLGTGLTNEKVGDALSGNVN